MVGALAFEPVGKQHDERGPLAPFLLRGRDELVDDGLRADDEVAELGLPQHERIGALDGVPILEPQRGVLAQG